MLGEGGRKISTPSNVLDTLKGTMLSQTLPIRTINSDKSSGNNIVSIQLLAARAIVPQIRPPGVSLATLRLSFIYIYALCYRGMT